MFVRELGSLIYFLFSVDVSEYRRVFLLPPPSPLLSFSTQPQHPATVLPAGGMVQDGGISCVLLLLLLLRGGADHDPLAGGVSGHVIYQGECSRRGRSDEEGLCKEDVQYVVLTGPHKWVGG